MTTVKRSAIPGWAWDIIEAVERGEGIAVDFEWRVRRGRYERAIHLGERLGKAEAVERWRAAEAENLRWSSGRAFHSWTPRIVVSAGSDELDTRMVLLHELAHVVAGVGAWHGPRWRKVALRMYRRYGGPAVVAYAAENERKKRLAEAAGR